MKGPSSKRMMQSRRIRFVAMPYPVMDRRIGWTNGLANLSKRRKIKQTGRLCNKVPCPAFIRRGRNTLRSSFLSIMPTHLWEMCDDSPIHYWGHPSSPLAVWCRVHQMSVRRTRSLEHADSEARFPHSGRKNETGG